MITINVDEWKVRVPWDFDYEDIERSAARGTQIQITALNDGVREMFGDAVFKNELVKAIARDYAFFIQQGLKISVGADSVPSYKFQLRQSDQVAPSVEQYEDNGVHVRILAGLVDDLPDDIPDELKPGKVDRYGWFVICNDRVVLAADKNINRGRLGRRGEIRDGRDNTRNHDRSKSHLAGSVQVDDGRLSLFGFFALHFSPAECGS